MTRGATPCAAAAARTTTMRLVTGAVLPAFNHPLKLAGEIAMLDAISGGRAEIGFARAFVEACRTATEKIGQDLKLQTAAADDSQAEPLAARQAPTEGTAAPVLDLRGVMCPLNYVKTKLKLEMMDAGERLEVWLDAGDPIKNVPMSLRNDGHKILAEEPLEAAAAQARSRGAP